MLMNIILYILEQPKIGRVNYWVFGVGLCPSIEDIVPDQRKIPASREFDG